MKSTLRAYMVSDGEPVEAAVLVFAHTARETKRVAWPTIHDMTSCYWIDVEVQWLRNAPASVWAESDPDKLARGEAHIIESPRVCKGCKLWGKATNEDGYCEDCEEEMGHE